MSEGLARMPPRAGSICHRRLKAINSIGAPQLNAAQNNLGNYVLTDDRVEPSVHVSLVDKDIKPIAHPATYCCVRSR